MPKNIIKPVWNQGFWCFGTSQIIKNIKKTLHQCKKTLCHKRRFSTVLKASKFMILRNAKNVIKPVWNQGFWCFGTSQIIKNIKKALHQRKKVPPDKSTFSTVLKTTKLMILRDAKNVIKPVWNQGFWCFGTSQIIKNIKKALHQRKKVPPDKSTFSTVLKTTKLMILRDAKNVIKPVWNQGFWCFGTSQIIKTIKKTLYQRKKSHCHKPRCYMISKSNDHKMQSFIVFF